jgi:hypothetical protein
MQELQREPTNVRDHGTKFSRPGGRSLCAPGYEGSADLRNTPLVMKVPQI